MYKNILVPVLIDPEHEPTEAIGVAQEIAAPGAAITFLHVIEELPGYATSYVAADYLKRSEEAVRTRLEELASKVPGGVAKVAHGHSARTILDLAQESGSDCIIVSSHKPGVSDYFLGGTAARVVRYAQCAVHVIR